MGLINLADAKVAYEGHKLPAVNLISKLQTDLQEVAAKLAVIAEALGELQSALLDSATVEVKLTLTREDFGRFKSLAGGDDSERIRRAVLALIHPEEAGDPLSAVKPRLVAAPAAQPTERTLPRQQANPEHLPNKKSPTICPSCQALIDVPELFSDQCSVEVKCAQCGAKCLLKSKF